SRLERFAERSEGAGGEARKARGLRRWLERANVDRAVDRVRAYERRWRDAIDQLNPAEFGRVDEREIEGAGAAAIDGMTVDFDERLRRIGPAQCDDGRCGGIAAGGPDDRHGDGIL